LQATQMTKARRKLERPRVEMVSHVVEIADWNWNYMFSIDRTSFRTEPYFDCRHLNINGRVLKPDNLRATNATLTCFPMHRLLESERSKDQPKCVGVISHRGKDYSANLHMPLDALTPVLQMLMGGRYRYVSMEANKSFRGEALIINYCFAETIDESDYE
jgi:hypothetical protein